MTRKQPLSADQSKVRDAIFDFVLGDNTCPGDFKLVRKVVTRRAFGAAVSVVNRERGAQITASARREAQKLGTMFWYNSY